MAISHSYILYFAVGFAAILFYVILFLAKKNPKGFFLKTFSLSFKIISLLSFSTLLIFFIFHSNFISDCKKSSSKKKKKEIQTLIKKDQYLKKNFGLYWLFLIAYLIINI